MGRPDVPWVPRVPRAWPPPAGRARRGSPLVPRRRAQGARVPGAGRAGAVRLRGAEPGSRSRVTPPRRIQSPRSRQGPEPPRAQGCGRKAPHSPGAPRCSEARSRHLLGSCRRRGLRARGRADAGRTCPARDPPVQSLRGLEPPGVPAPQMQSRGAAGAAPGRAGPTSSHPPPRAPLRAPAALGAKEGPEAATRAEAPAGRGAPGAPTSSSALPPRPVAPRPGAGKGEMPAFKVRQVAGPALVTRVPPRAQGSRRA